MKYLFSVLLLGMLWLLAAQELSEWDIDFEDESSDAGGSSHEHPLSIHGSIDARLRYHYEGTFPDNMVDSALNLGLDLTYTGKITDAVIALEASTRMLQEEEVAAALRSFIGEAYVNISIPETVLTFGYYKPLWLSGDDLNVVDVFLPLDLRFGDSLSYVERRRAQLLVKSATYLGSWGLIELMYLPLFEPDILPKADSIWALPFFDDIAALSNDVDNDVAINNTFSPSLEHSQLGMRFSATVGRFDFAFLYAYTRLRLPRVEFDFAERTADFHYDPVHVFSVEANALLGKIAWWIAASYYLTYDITGDDPEQVDNHIRYRAYFEWTLPLSNLVLTGAVEGVQFFHQQDPVYEDGNIFISSFYNNHTNLVFRLSDSYFSRALTLAVEAEVSMLDFDWSMGVFLELYLPDNLSFFAQSIFYEGDGSGGISQFGDNDFIEISIRYAF